MCPSRAEVRERGRVKESMQSEEGRPPESAPNVLQRGARVGRYVIASWLGEGGMGAVYRARELALMSVVNGQSNSRPLRDDRWLLAGVGSGYCCTGPGMER